jgi:hypothetical protein
MLSIAQYYVKIDGKKIFADEMCKYADRIQEIDNYLNSCKHFNIPFNRFLTKDANINHFINKDYLNRSITNLNDIIFELDYLFNLKDLSQWACGLALEIFHNGTNLQELLENFENNNLESYDLFTKNLYKLYYLLKLIPDDNTHIKVGNSAKFKKLIKLVTKYLTRFQKES